MPAAGSPAGGFAHRRRSDKRQGRVALIAAAAVGGLVAVSLGAYGQLHAPTGRGIATFGFPAVLPMKAWVTSGAALLALIQLASALALWGRLPLLQHAPAWLATFHRWTGTVAFLLTLPVAYHCLWSLGFRSGNARVLVHSLSGCLFYGALATKLLVLRAPKLPAWALPVAGGSLVALITGLWLTSSLWFFTTST